MSLHKKDRRRGTKTKLTCNYTNWQVSREPCLNYVSLDPVHGKSSYLDCSQSISPVHANKTDSMINKSLIFESSKGRYVGTFGKNGAGNLHYQYLALG